MPMYDFECQDCHKRFEDLLFEGDENPACPACASRNTVRLVSMPSPLKTGAFPFKVGPVYQPFVDRVRAAEAGKLPTCGGGCASCQAAAPAAPAKDK